MPVLARENMLMLNVFGTFCVKHSGMQGWLDAPRVLQRPG